jgi:hypothetical protein
MTAYRHGPMPHEPAEKGPYKEFAPYARFRSVPYAGAIGLSILDEGRTIRLSYSLNSGTINGYDVSVPIAPTPVILLRPETSTDKEGKARGINREVQVGDSTFDDRVYIESDAEDQAILRALPDEVRSAVLRLFEKGASSVLLGLHRAQFNVPTADRRNIFDPQHMEAVIAATRALARIPAISPHAVVPNTGGNGTVLLSVLFSFAAVPLMIAALVVWPLCSIGLPFLAALVGFTAWWLSRSTFARSTAGHSRSYRRYLTSLGFTFFAFPAAAIAIAVTMNGALDHAAERVRSGKITNVSSDDDGTTIDVRWDDGSSTSTSHFSGVPKAGLRVTGHFHPGALAAEWREKPLQIHFP